MQNPSPANAKKLMQFEALKTRLFEQSLRRGFYGKIAFEVNIQDGTIQDIRRRVEQIDK